MRVREILMTYRGRTERGARITNDREAFAFFSELPEMQGAAESFLVLLLDAKNRPLGWHLVARGSVSGCVVTIADVFRPVIAGGAAGFMVAHNHPSGDPTPSPDDTALTEVIARGAKLLGLRMLDHVIVGSGSTECFSFMAAGLLGGTL